MNRKSKKNAPIETRTQRRVRLLDVERRGCFSRRMTGPAILSNSPVGKPNTTEA